MFRIKICGVTTVQDAVLCADCGADAIGLNFYPPSPRYVTLDTARSIVSALPPHVTKIGVFVNAPCSELVQAYDHVGLDMLQLHGDEPPQLIRDLAKRPVIKAFRCKTTDTEVVIGYLLACRALAAEPASVLLDAYAADSYGGTGIAINWQFVSEVKRRLDDRPLVLAGGLTPENVDQAIRAARPAAVDTASGVESSPGKKDPDRTRAFVENARAAFAHCADAEE